MNGKLFNIKKTFNYIFHHLNFFLENEILNQFKKEPFQAPCVLSDRQNDTKHIESAFMAKFTLTATEQIKEKTENVYLFENIDKNCLKADENIINQIYR